MSSGRPTLDPRGFWELSGVSDAPGPGRRDAVFVAVVATAATIEVFARDAVVWPVVSWLAVVGVACLLPWRRVRPLAVVALGFGTMSAIDVVALVRDVEWEGLVTGAFLLVLPYALTRWASGRDVGAGLLVMTIPLVLTALGGDPVGDTIGGAVVLLLSCTLGAVARYSNDFREQELAGMRSREREELARELHDIVAHHVSAIAVRAQAGQAVAATDPTAAIDALAVIEEEASRALSEMRSMVGTLRHDDQPELRPQQGARDIARFADDADEVQGPGPRVDVSLTGDLVSLRPSLDAACYRIAQEAVTNARRHARGARVVQVTVDGTPDGVVLSIRDDGRSTTNGSNVGFGLVGMAERAKLLGGTFEAGPAPSGGWFVRVDLPRGGQRT